MELNDECLRLLGKIKYLKAEAKHLARDKDILRWREECRSYAAELATELLRLYPAIVPLA